MLAQDLGGHYGVYGMTGPSNLAPFGFHGGYIGVIYWIMDKKMEAKILRLDWVIYWIKQWSCGFRILTKIPLRRSIMLDGPGGLSMRSTPQSPASMAVDVI